MQKMYTNKKGEVVDPNTEVPTAFHLNDCWAEDIRQGEGKSLHESNNCNTALHDYYQLPDRPHPITKTDRNKNRLPVDASTVNVLVSAENKAINKGSISGLEHHWITSVLQ